MFQRNNYKSNTEKPWHEIEDPVASIKYDGAGFFLHFDSAGSPKLSSRRESVKGGFPEKSNRLPHIADVKLPEFVGHVYQVELIHTGNHPANQESHPVVSGILNSLPEKAIATQKEKGPVQVVLLSTINPPPKNFEENVKEMKKAEKAFNKPNLVFTPQYHYGKENIVKLINSTKSTGREGIVITSSTKPEFGNTRIKLKHLDTYNLLVGKVNQLIDKNGETREEMGSLELFDGKGRDVGNVGTGFTKEQRISIWQNRRDWEGKRMIQVKTMGIGGADKMGKLRMPVYNGDPDGELDIV